MQVVMLIVPDSKGTVELKLGFDGKLNYNMTTTTILIIRT